jgi:tetratricopeptide (TPR) repeat protein
VAVISVDMREMLNRYEASGGEELYEAARRLYESALAATPDDPVLRRDYGYLRECHGRRAIEAAVASYERALELDAREEKTRLQLVHALASLGRHRDAIAGARTLLAERPDDPGAYRCLAYAYVAAGDLAEAERAITAGLAIAPGDAHLVELSGDVLAGIGHPAEALARWREAFELDPDNLSPRYSSVFLLQREGRLREAAAEWRAILSWCEARDYSLDAEWPRRELSRLEAALGN